MVEPLAKSVAVLPFANMSADPDNEYFSDGITDDIIAQLSKINDLKVTSRTSAMLYKDTNKNLQTIGRELKVATVLEGSVRRSANRVRIISQLIDVQNDAHLWAETYDRDLTDIFAIQSDVAGKIATALQATLSPTARESINRKPTENIDAYNHYLLGTHFFNKFTPASGEKALQCFEEAIALDSEFALAYVGLANAYFSLAAGQGRGQLAPSEAYQFAKEAVQRALEIDDSIADAHATLGSVYTWYEWNWPAAEAAFEHATALGCGCQEPNVKYGFYLAARGRHDEAIAAAKTALELDPISLIVQSHLALQYWWARRFDEALTQVNRAMNLDATFPPALAVLGWVYIQMGRIDDAIGVFEGIIAAVGRVSSMLAALACAYTRAGRIDEADGILVELERNKAGDDIFVSSREIALIRAWRGDRAGAMDWLERAFEERAAFLSFIAVDTIWDDLRQEPRFQALVENIGLT
jgi:TolB-like protein/Flp pilus assembly protein TadD